MTPEPSRAGTESCPVKAQPFVAATAVAAGASPALLRTIAAPAATAATFRAPLEKRGKDIFILASSPGPVEAGGSLPDAPAGVSIAIRVGSNSLLGAAVQVEVVGGSRNHVSASIEERDSVLI